MSNSVGQRIVKGTIVIVLVGILAKIASFISEAILAAYLGTSFQSDAYYMVSSIQAVIYPMLGVGVWKVFLPLYKSRITSGNEQEADQLTNKVITFFSIVSFIFVVLLIVFADIVVSVVAPGYKNETRELCIKLVRIAAPMYFFIITAAIYASILQAKNIFLGSQIREVASHIPTIIAAVVFYRLFGVEALAVALVVGGAARLLIELPFVNWGYKYKPDFKFHTTDFVLLLKRLPSALISEGVTQINTLVDKAMASSLPTGTVSALNYGHKLVNVFSGLLSTSISTALYPQMIELITLKKNKELSKLVVKIMIIFGIIMIPVTLACVLFSYELVEVVFQRGSFNSESTILTSGVFAFYSIGILFIACNTVITNLFYGYGNTRTPMLISFANLAINITLNLVLIRIMGINGLALATSLSAVLTFFIRFVAVLRYIDLDIKHLIISTIKISVVAILACFIPRVFFWYISCNSYIVLFSATTIGILIYFVLLRKMRMSEIDDLKSILLKKISRKKNN